MSRVLSYLRDGSFEYLADHVNSCLSFLSELRESRIGRTGSSIDHGFLKSVRIAVVFHDLGKAFYEKERWRDEDRMSFPGHELISAYILGKYREEIYKDKLYRYGDLSPEEIEEMSMVLIPSLFAVTLHHHAMGLNERLSYLDRAKLRPSHFDDLKQELSLLQSDAVLPEEREILYRVLDEARSRVEGGDLNTREIGRYVKENVLYRIYRCFGGKEDIRMKKLCYLCLVSLVTADYMAAGEKRGGKTRFSDVIREFHKIYMKRVL